MVAWLNRFPDIPVSVDLIDYELIEPDTACMALSIVQSTYIVERYISGAYVAEYQFKVVYRVKPGKSPDSRLKADEMLDRLGDWISTNRPDIGENLAIQELEQTTRSSLFARMEGGWEDHQIFMRMTYKVNPGK
ncbi:hypothetical protein D1159_12640 [Pseudoflavonifractor sp. 524-17]|nr:hypothetical protein [Pseudoflavonifractor sp. 524-17]